MEEPQHKAEKRCPERSGLRVSFLPPCSAFPAFPLGVLSSIICWQTLTNVWLSIQCHWNRMSWSCLRILFLLLLLHLFFFLLRPYTWNPLSIYYSLADSQVALLQITLFLVLRRSTFSVTPSPVTVWCTAVHLSCGKNMGSCRVSQLFFDQWF